MLVRYTIIHYILTSFLMDFAFIFHIFLFFFLFHCYFASFFIFIYQVHLCFLLFIHFFSLIQYCLLHSFLFFHLILSLFVMLCQNSVLKSPYFIFIELFLLIKSFYFLSIISNFRCFQYSNLFSFRQIQHNSKNLLYQV